MGLGAAMGAALAALWHGLWPYAGPHVFAPNLFAFTALSAAVVLVGVRDTFNAMTRRPMEPGLAAAEIVVGSALALLVTGRFLPFVVALVLLVGIRGQAGILTRVVIDLYDQGTAEVARRVRQTFSRFALGYGALLTVFLLFSGLDHSASLLHWSTAPIVIGAGVCALVLISGAEYEVMRSRFRGGEVTADASFGTGWWGPAGGLIAAIVVLAALIPPLPSVLTLRDVGNVVLAVGQHTTNGGSPQNVVSTAAAVSSSTNAVTKFIPAPIRAHIGLLIFLTLAAAFVVTIVIRLVLSARRLGMDGARLLQDYAGRTMEAAKGAVAFFAGFYTLVMQGLAGDWSGMRRFLRRWWLWILDVLTGHAWRNVWRQLTIRSASHRAGAEFAADMGPRTMAGAVWNLPPGDPRRRVRELYRSFMQEARDAGMARRPSQTPAAYRRAIAALEPDTGDGLTELTGAYEWARFSPHPVTAEHVGQASRGWERVAGFIVRMRERTVAARRRGDDQDGQVREEAQAEGQGVQQVRRKR